MRPYSRVYYPALDGLRALAVLSVILYHSEYCWWYICRKVQCIFGFCYRRARRLSPAFIFTELISAILGWLLLSPANLERFSESILFAIVSLSNFYFLSEARYFEPASAFRPLLYFWSLAIEEQFYLVWPITLVFLLQFKKGIYMNGTKLGPSDTSAMRQYIESEEEGWFGIG